MIYLKLFISFLQVGAFSFGGGYAAIPLIEDQVVTVNSWMNVKEFADLVTISQMTPGPIAINAATFIGVKTAGIPGALASTLGCILPSCIIVTIIAQLYMKYRKLGAMQSVLKSLRPAVVSMIASAGVTILIAAFWESELKYQLSGLHPEIIVIFIVAFILLRKTKLNPILIMLIAGLLNVGYTQIVELIK